jgi:hypothetical protein
MLNVVLWSMHYILFMDTHPSLAMNTSYLWLLSTWQIGNINFDPPPNLLIIDLKLRFAFTLQHHIVRHRFSFPTGNRRFPLPASAAKFGPIRWIDLFEPTARHSQ